MTVSLIPTPRIQFTDLDGAPLVGGTVATYIPGTFTPSTTYQDSLGTVPNANPLTLDALGSCSMWGSGSYRMIVLDVNSNLIFDAITTAPALETGILLAANNLSDVASASSARTNLGLGTAATANTGTSGTTVPLLSNANTWSAGQTFTGAVTLNGGGTTTPEVPPAITEIGYLGVPQNIQTAAYTLAITDAGGEVFVGASVNVTIPPNASVAFPIGTTIDLVWDQTYSGIVTQGAGVTLRNPIGNVTGNRTITGPGTCTVKQEKINEWWVRGSTNMT